jgi:predicted site-specific integrase-resolvase
MEKPDFLSPAQVGAALGKTEATIRIWVRKGLIRDVVMIGSGRYGIPPSEFERLKRELESREIAAA